MLRDNLDSLSADELLDLAYNAEDDAEIAELVNKALELEPDNPEALLLLSDIRSFKLKELINIFKVLIFFAFTAI